MMTEICVPTAALQQQGEDGQGIAPGGGDEVQGTFSGRVTREEGGNSYIELSEVNGQPVGGEMPAEAPDEGAALDEEMRGYRDSGAGLVGLWLVAGLLLMLFAAASAQAAPLRMSTDRVCSGGAVSNYVALTNMVQQGQYAQVSSVEINNFSGATLYLLVFDSATNQLVNAAPHFTAVPVPTGTVGFKDWGASGARFLYGVNVCLSTTPFSLTNATAGGTATVIHTKASE